MVLNYITNIITQLKLTINRITADKFLIFFSLIIALIFLTLVYFLYNRLIKPLIYKDHVINKEFTSKKDITDNDVLIIIFKTEWCPICTDALKTNGQWEKFKSLIKSRNSYMDYKIVVSEVDCDEKPKIADKYNIDAYPTVKLIYKGDIYTYDAQINAINLLKFIDSVVD